MQSRTMENIDEICPKQRLLCWLPSIGLLELSGDSVKVSDITDENKTANLIARIVSTFEVKEFTRSDGTKGRVGNLIVGDETGKIRVTLWDNVADLLKNGEINVGKLFRSADLLNMVIPE